jgi:hypothetical protein
MVRKLISDNWSVQADPDSGFEFVVLVLGDQEYLLTQPDYVAVTIQLALQGPDDESGHVGEMSDGD